MKKTISDKKSEEIPHFSANSPVSVFIGFEDPETEVLLRKEYLGMKNFKMVMEQSHSLLGKKQKPAASLNIPAEKKMATKIQPKTNNSAQYYIDNSANNFSFVVDKKLLKNEKVVNIKDNIKKKPQAQVVRQKKEEPLIDMVEDEYAKLFEGTFKKKEDIVVKQKLEVKYFN